MPEGDSTWHWVHKFHQNDLPCQGIQGQIITVVATGGLISCHQLWRDYKQYKKLKGDLRIKNETSMFLSGEALEKDLFTMHQAILIAKTSS